MTNSEHKVWLKQELEKLINEDIKYSEEYNENIIREYLVFIFNVQDSTTLLNFFIQNADDEKLLRTLLNILLDESEEYSNDARYSAARIIPLFNTDILKKYKKELLYAQNYDLINLKPYPKEQPGWL